MNIFELRSGIQSLDLLGDIYYSGGLPSYGLMIMILLPVLQHLRRNANNSVDGNNCSGRSSGRSRKNTLSKLDHIDTPKEFPSLTDLAPEDNKTDSTIYGSLPNNVSESCHPTSLKLSASLSSPSPFHESSVDLPSITSSASPGSHIRLKHISNVPIKSMDNISTSSESDIMGNNTAEYSRYIRFNSINRRREYGKLVALQLLDLDIRNFHKSLAEIPILLPDMLAHSEFNPNMVSLSYGSIIADALSMYGDMELGRHGFSTRHG